MGIHALVQMGLTFPLPTWKMYTSPPAAAAKMYKPLRCQAAHGWWNRSVGKSYKVYCGRQSTDMRLVAVKY